MRMPVVVNHSSLDPANNTYYRVEPCRSCGDEQVIRIDQFPFPELVNWRLEERWHFVRLDSHSKCVYCYL